MPLIHSPTISTSFHQSATNTDSPDTIESHKERSPSPPPYSPITPKLEPVIPAIKIADSLSEPAAIVDSNHPAKEPGNESEKAAIPPTRFVPEPLPKPFSSADSIDGLALKAAISSLQFQKQKAQDDIQALERLKKLALADPEKFATELASGKLKEQRHQFGNIQDIVDAQSESNQSSQQLDSDSFGAVPGPQNVVRMPHINWDKYHVHGESLDALHDQQQRWPGSMSGQKHLGREYAVMAPYSPFEDGLHNDQRKASGGRGQSTPSASVAPTPTVAEHPYETRRSSKQ